MRQSYVFKLCAHRHNRRLHASIDVAASIFNHAVAVHRRFYRLYKITLPRARMQAHLAKLRRTRRPAWRAVGSQAVQELVERLYAGWELFFRAAKEAKAAGRKCAKRPPGFRARRKYASFTLKQAGWKLAGHGRVVIGGRPYRFHQSRAVAGVVKTLTVRRDRLGDLYLIFSCDGVPQPESAPKTGLSAGCDFGLRTFLTLSDGTRVVAPQPLQRALRQLRQANRALARKQKGSNSRRKAIAHLNRVHRRIRHVRADWQWKSARQLALRYDLLAFETLNLDAMRRLWGRKVSDLALNTYLQKQAWQCAKMGKLFVQVDRWEPTTRRCSGCGHRQNVPLNQRVFHCGGCGRLKDRDQNAGENILAAGEAITKQAGRGLRPGDTSKPGLAPAGVATTAESHRL